MVDMEKRQKQLVGLTRRQRKSGCSSSSPIDSNGGDESECGDRNAALRWKKGKGRASRWRLSNGDMNGMFDAAGSDGEEDDAILSSLATTSFSSLISRKRVRTLGKVSEDCDAVDPAPVPRKLRSAINKRTGQTVSALSPNFKKRRHLPIFNTQTTFINCKIKFNKSLSWDSFTKEEEEVAEALVSLAQMPPHCLPTTNKAISDDRSNANVVSTSYSEVPIKEDDKKIMLPSAANGVAMDHPVERNDNVPQVKPVSNGTYQPCNSTDPPLSKDERTQDISLGISANLPNSYGLSSKDYTGNSALEQMKLQVDANPIYPALKPEAPVWLVRTNGSEVVVHKEQIAKNTGEKEIAPLVQTSFPCTSNGYLITSSSNKLAACANTATGTAKASSTGSYDKLPPIKTWKKCLTHVYVSHLIQMHLNKEKTSTPTNQAKLEEGPHSCISTAPKNNTFKEKSIQEASIHTMHWDVRLLTGQPASDLSDTTNAQQRMLGDDFLNSSPGHAVDTSRNGLKLSGSQHVQYLHPQVTHRAAMPVLFPHVPYARENIASASIQQIPQYMCSPCYPLRPCLAGGSAAMELQQHLPAQQQQMWQFHVPQYRATADATPTMWQTSRLQDLPSLRPMSMLPSAMPPRLELFCGPYQSANRQPPQLRLI